jgi:hypothetical protein
MIAKRLAGTASGAASATESTDTIAITSIDGITVKLSRKPIARERTGRR